MEEQNLITPGPWNIGRPGGPAGPFWSLVNPKGNVVAMQIVGEANARLIAATPMLLEACELALAWLSRVYPDEIWPGEGDEDSDGREARLARERCRAAIAESKRGIE